MLPDVVPARLNVKYQPISCLTLNPRNSRTHSKKQLRQIAESVRQFGFINPVLVDRQNLIVAGHGRVAAAGLLGLTEVPTICVEHLTPEQVRAYVISDNRLAEKAGWDPEILARELEYLLTMDVFDVEITGFEMAEIDMILGESKSTSQEDSIDLPCAPISKTGDLWLLGRHRIFCGSSLEEVSYKTLMGTKRASLVFTDPPYNVPISGNVSGKGRVKHRDFQMATGEMSGPEYIAFLNRSFQLQCRYSTEGSVHFLCLDWRHAKEILAASENVYDSLLNICVWVKPSGRLGSFYRSQHEFIFVFRNGKDKHQNNIQLGKFGRNRTNVWEYQGISSISDNGGEGNLLELHPTVKPVPLVADAILDCSDRGGIVLDAFLGSGSTLLAAEKIGRVCHGIEIDPRYVDVAIRRWQRWTGDKAVHAETGKAFDEISQTAEANHAE